MLLSFLATLRKIPALARYLYLSLKPDRERMGEPTQMKWAKNVDGLHLYICTARAQCRDISRPVGHSARRTSHESCFRKKTHTCYFSKVIARRRPTLQLKK